MFSFHQGEECAFLSLGASLGLMVYFMFSLQFDVYILLHRSLPTGTTVFHTELTVTEWIMSLSMDPLVGELPTNV